MLGNGTVSLPGHAARPAGTGSVSLWWPTLVPATDSPSSQVDLGSKIQGSSGVPGWESIPSGVVGGFGAGSKRKGELRS